jgi:hypothetical protein
MSSSSAREAKGASVFDGLIVTVLGKVCSGRVLS